MKQTLFTFITLLLLSVSVHTKAQFYNTFDLRYRFENESSAIQLNNAFVFGFTASVDNQNFHKKILLIKTNATGKILWSKFFDAGTGISVKLFEMIRTFNNELLISGETGADNSGNYKKFLIKINSAGNVVWAKKYNTGFTYDSRSIAQLKDSSFVFAFTTAQSFPGLIQVDKNGNIIAAGKFTKGQFGAVQSIIAVDNNAEVVVANATVADVNVAAHSVLKQKQYKTSNQFTAFINSRCKNGDIIYLAGRTQGGILSGTSRVFRTTSNGNLLWAKNIAAFKDSSGSPFSIFDIVAQNYIHEDISGNIVAMVEDESTTNLIVVLNANGKYLYNRYLSNLHNFIAEANDGSYLNTSNRFLNASHPVLFSNRFIKRKTPCDSSLIVTITNGTDSAATPDKLKFENAVVNSDDVTVSAANAGIKAIPYCNLSLQQTVESKDALPITIIPNPAHENIIVRTLTDLPFTIYNINGRLLINAVTNHNTDISKLISGIYRIAIKDKDKTISKVFIKN